MTLRSLGQSFSVLSTSPSCQCQGTHVHYLFSHPIEHTHIAHTETDKAYIHTHTHSHYHSCFSTDCLVHADTCKGLGTPQHMTIWHFIINLCILSFFFIILKQEYSTIFLFVRFVFIGNQFLVSSSNYERETHLPFQRDAQAMHRGLSAISPKETSSLASKVSSVSAGLSR